MNAFNGKIAIEHSTGVAFAGLEVPAAALASLTNMQIVERYIAPAAVAVLELLRQQRQPRGSGAIA